MAKQYSGDYLSEEVRQQNNPLFHCDLLRSTTTNIGTYSSDMARKIEDVNDFKTERIFLQLFRRLAGVALHGGTGGDIPDEAFRLKNSVTAHPLYKPLKLNNSFRANCSGKIPLSLLAATI